jgi:hypothetical protein
LEVLEVSVSNGTVSSNDSPAPPKIVIKVNSKSPKNKKAKKMKVICCIDAFFNEPGKAFPKIPLKQQRSKQSEMDSENQDQVRDDQLENGNAGLL